MPNRFISRLTNFFFILIPCFSGIMMSNDILAQSVSIRQDQQPAHASAILDLQSDHKGFLMPKLSSVQRTSVSMPAQGLLVYDQNVKSIWSSNSSQWRDIRMGTSDSLWTSSGSNFYYSAGLVGIGTSSPASTFHIKSNPTTPATMRIYNKLASGGVAGLYFTPVGSTWRIELKEDNMLKFYNTDNPLAMTIGTNGNVGIGMNAGSDKLMINGGMKVTGNATGTSVIVNNEIKVHDANFSNRMTIVSPNMSTGPSLRINGQDGNAIVRMGQHAGYPNHGSIRLIHHNESKSINMYVDGSGDGRLQTEWVKSHHYKATSPSGSSGGKTDFHSYNNTLNTKVSFINGAPDRGFVGVYDIIGNQQASMYVNADGEGVVAGDVKSFFMTDPRNDQQEIWYASLEGPELGAYCRGNATIINGEAKIEWPNHFALVTNLSTLTIHITPQSLESKGLYVADQNERGFTVRELHNGQGSYTFSWEATGVRKGKEDFEIIRSKRNMPQGF